ncbi:SDR family NAD(P)-dependent oxidoreductase [Terricaulis sp.]|uniref:SDR family NAD(P)-dependent oxidoreductase n=1 Tax=Terricaulis sp. TaxID=2768686 RepID=UPI0037843431
MNTLFDLCGKTALITGGSRGLGLEMALAFADAGADIIVASRKLENCEEVAERIRGAGRKALALRVHAGKWDDIDRLVEAAYGAFRKIDILVNNAGMSPAVDSHEVTEDLFDKVVALNFKGPFHLAALVGHRMAQGDGGSIINISSGASWKAMPRVVAYAGAKAALNAMTIALAQEYGPKVRVNAIAAGPFLTDISKAWSEEQRQSAPNAAGRPGRPEEIVTTALYLASPASSFVSGTIVRCDGALR